jgi:transcriptional regulator with XRE-family HTH domain
MASSQALVDALKLELKAAGLSYADVASHLGLALSSVKRMLARGEMPLSRIDAILQLLRLDFAELARRVADSAPLLRELSLEQERAVVADRKLLLVAISCLSQWTAPQMLASYRFSETELLQYLLRLDKLGIIELREHNRYRLRVSKMLRWQAHGPVMRYFRERVMRDYYAGDFHAEGETLLLVHGEVALSAALAFNEKLERLVEDFARQHRADQKLPEDRKLPFTLVLGMRQWWFEAFHDLRRDTVPPPDGVAQTPGRKALRTPSSKG